MLDFDDADVYNALIKVAKIYGVDPSSSIDTETFFRNLLQNYPDKHNPHQIDEWLHVQISEKFVALGARPIWKQDPEWPLQNGKPMIFMGQIDIKVHHGSMETSLFHDDTSFYIFFSSKETPKVVIQQL